MDRELGSNGKGSDDYHPRGGSGLESLADIAKRLRKAMKEGESASYAVAKEVMRMANAWESYRAEAGGAEIGPWLRQHIDARHALSWYEKRARVAEELGAGMAARLTPKAGVWYLGQVTKNDDRRKELNTKISEVYRANNSMPLNCAQLALIAKSYVTKKRGYRDRQEDKIRMLEARVEKLRAQVRALGAEPVE